MSSIFYSGLTEKIVYALDLSKRMASLKIDAQGNAESQH